MKEKLFALLCLLLAVAGCSGSSGSAAVSPPVMPPPVAPPPVAPPPVVPPPPELLPPPPAPALVQTASGLENEYAAVQTVNHSAFNLVRLPRAYANIYSELGAQFAGHPGWGSRVGVIDSGIDISHPSFAGKDIAAFLARGGNISSVAAANTASLIAFHGTAVSGVATALPTGSVDPSLSIQGVAPAADLTVLVIPLGDAPPPGEEISAITENELRQRAPPGQGQEIRFMLDPARQRLDALNLSFAIFSNIEDYSEEALRMGVKGYITALAQQYRGDNKIVVVMAAGNFNGQRCVAGSPSCTIMEADPNNSNASITRFDGSSPAIPSGLMAKIPELRGHTVAVVAVNPVDGEISDFSQRCGIAAEWCIAAPGQFVPVPISNVQDNGVVDRLIGTRAGTSFSAPIVSGGLALLRQRFRGQMAGPQMLSRLFATADKSGVYADTMIYGQGLLDLGAATEPVGRVMVAGGSADSFGSDLGLFSALGDTALIAGGALGDSLETAFQGGEIAAFDSLGAPFWYPMDSFVTYERTEVLNSQLLSLVDFSSGGGSARAARRVVQTPLVKPRARAGGDGGFETRGGAIPTVFASAGVPVTSLSGEFSRKAGHLSFLKNHLSLGFNIADVFAISAFASSPQEERRSSGAVLSYSPPGLPFDLRSGWVMENESLFGGWSTGAFGELSAVTGFAGVEFHYGFGGWRFFADAEAGSVSAGGNGGMIGGASGIFTSAFSVRMEKDLPGGSRVRLSLLSPLRVESGAVNLNVPTGRTQQGKITRDFVTANLSPSGRQMDFSAQIAVPVPAGSMSVGAVVTRHPGHNETREPSFSLLAGYAARF